LSCRPRSRNLNAKRNGANDGRNGP
jgi:hypothetical protein